MDYKKLSSVRFWDSIDHELTRDRFSGQRRPSLYPSEASVICIDPKTGKASIEGGCHRKSWYRMMGYKQSKNTPKTELIFKFGNYLEAMLTDLIKLGYSFEGNSIKFFDPETLVSGEVDIVLRHPDGGIILTEVKSSYGDFKRRELMGGSWYGKPLIGYPSTNNLLQLVTYLWFHKDREDLLGGKLIYILRDKMDRIEFDIHLDTDKTGKHRVFVNNKPDMRFYAEDIFERYATLKSIMGKSFAELKKGVKLKDLTPPDREYTLQHTDEDIETLHGEYEFPSYIMRKVSDTKYKAFKKTPSARPGDFQCNYCGFKDICWTAKDIKDHIGTKKVTETAITEEAK